jgi:hypothetical protein
MVDSNIINNFVIKLGRGQNNLSINNSEDPKWKSSTDLFGYEYSIIVFEMFASKQREGWSFGFSSQAIDEQTFENKDSYDSRYGNYFIGGSNNSDKYYKLTFTDISSWEAGTSTELFIAYTINVIKIYASTTPTYEYQVDKYKRNYYSGDYEQDPSYYESGTLGGFNFGFVLRVPLRF